MKAVYISDSRIVESGTGGGTVSFHENKALKELNYEVETYGRLNDLVIDYAYPNNPFMFDYFIAGLLKNPSKIKLAHFYGASFSLTMKRLNKAMIYMTIPAHNLEESLKEWSTFQYNNLPPQHLTNPYLFSLMCEGLTSRADAIITPSETSAEYIEKKFHRQPIIIPHGCNIPPIDPRWRDLRSTFKVAHMGQFGPDKGQKYLIEAWKKADVNGGLILAGSEHLKLLVNNTSNVFCNPYLSEEQKKTFYGCASVYIQPSVTEGFGITVLEAMSYEVPVIVTEGVGAKDVVSDGEDGFIVPIRDPDAIAEKIKYFADNPSEVTRMGLNARNKAKRYEWGIIENMYKKTWSI